MTTRTLLSSMLALTILASACTPQLVLLEPGTLVLAPNQSASDGEVIVTFVEVVNDSRCPADATCMTSGFVQILLRVSDGSGTHDYTLTLGDMAEGDVNSIIANGYSIVLVDVQPYPLASQPTSPGDYRITLSVA